MKLGSQALTTQQEPARAEQCASLMLNHSTNNEPLDYHSLRTLDELDDIARRRRSATEPRTHRQERKLVRCKVRALQITARDHAKGGR